MIFGKSSCRSGIFVVGTFPVNHLITHNRQVHKSDKTGCIVLHVIPAHDQLVGKMRKHTLVQIVSEVIPHVVVSGAPVSLGVHRLPEDDMVVLGDPFRPLEDGKRHTSVDSRSKRLG
uniref:ORF101 n=1 Tax=Malaco herpesvirus 1 TaxID=3031797 RepID=A0AA48P7Y1_9VIRU|nr:TPA_asm: ORF101 [Malaco herpesvirus 1]